VRILGIDPGTIVCGYGLVDAGEQRICYVASGRISLGSKTPLAERLGELHTALAGIIDQYTPAVAAVEKVFFAKSVKSALSLGHARGAVVALAAARGLRVFEYGALEVKKAVVGYGRADKRQVQDMVMTLMGLDERPSEDSADALAVAICHANQSLSPISLAAERITGGTRR